MPQTPFKGKPEADRFMEPEEFRKLMEAAAKDLEAVRAFIVMGFGGFRTVEATKVYVRDLDLQKKGLWIKTAKRKDGNVRFIPLGQWFQLIADGAKGLKPTDQLLRSGDKPIWRRRIRYLFHKYKDRAGIRPCLGPHSLRHLAGIVRTEAGGQPQEVAAFLGHKTLDMVLVYANLRRERNEEIAEAAGEILFGPSKGRRKGGRKAHRH